MRSVIFLAIISTFLVSCAKAPQLYPKSFPGPSVSKEEIKESEMMLESLAAVQENQLSPEERVEMIRAAFKKLKASGNQICTLVYQGMHPDCREFMLAIRDRPSLNTFSYGYSKIAVHEDFLAYIDTEDEAAFLIAHNMAHHLADHYYEDRSDYTYKYVVAGYRTLPDGRRIYIDRRPGPGFREEGAHSYNIEQEYEADYIAAYLVTVAGYDVGAGIDFYKKMYVLNPTTGKAAKPEAGFFDTHPFSPSKLIRLQKAADEIAEKISKNQPLLPNEKQPEK